MDSLRLVIFPNFQKKNARVVAHRVCEILHTLGAEILLDSSLANEFADMPSTRFGAFSDLAKEADFAVAIGGDGTILKCAAQILGTETKLVGINTGRLGFMSTLEANELEKLERLMTEEYAISERMMLRASISGKGEARVFTALNDVYASRLSGRITDFSVYADDRLIGKYRADGVVFSTPTGSTAYSLSAGGPIIEPSRSCIEMTLICPHSLFARPVLFSAERRIRLTHEGEDKPRLYISVDGNEPVVLHAGEQLELTRSPQTISLVERMGTSFFETLDDKLMQTIKGTAEDRGTV